MSQATPHRPLLRAWLIKYTETSLIVRAIRAGWTMLLRLARLDPPAATAGGRGPLADSSQLAVPSQLAGPSSEPSRARALDLALLGQLLAARLAHDDDGGTPKRGAGFARLWAQRIVPLAIDEGCEWQLGMTAMIQGLTSPAGSAFNGKVGRISERLPGATPSDSRWELLVEGPQGVGSVNVRPANLRAPSSVAAVLAVWRLVPNRSQESPAALRLAELHAAVTDGEQHTVQALLLGGGVGLSASDAKGRTALHVALERLAQAAEEEAAEEAEEETEAEVEAAADGAQGPPSVVTADVQADLAQAQAELQAKLMAMVGWLLDRADIVQGLPHCPNPNHVDVNARDLHGRTPIYIAARAGLHDVARRLLAAHADPTLGPAGRPPLHEATARGDAALVKLILAGAAPNTAEAGEWSASHAKNARLKCVNGAGRGGWTALGLASRAGHVACVEALLEGGADPAAVVVNGKTALDIARLNQKGAIVALLESIACQVCD